MQATRDGRFLANVIANGVDETGPNNLATFIGGYRLTDELIGGEWVSLENETGQVEEITGWHYLEKRDGAVNESTINQLKSAFGWDGRDPMWLSDSDFSQVKVQLTLAWDTNPATNKTSLKVKWIDHMDATGGGVTKADDETRKSITTRLGSKLRAISGAPVASPKPSGKPTLPAATTPKPPARSAKPKAATATFEEAWDEFAKACATTPVGSEQAAVEKEFWDCLKRLFPKAADLEKLTPQEWAVAKEKAPGMILPV